MIKCRDATLVAIQKNETSFLGKHSTSIRFGSVDETTTLLTVIPVLHVISSTKWNSKST